MKNSFITIFEKVYPEKYLQNYSGLPAFIWKTNDRYIFDDLDYEPPNNQLTNAEVLNSLFFIIII